MDTRDEQFCYRLIVSAAQLLGKQHPTNAELIDTLRRYHKKLSKRMPNQKYLKAALKNFRKAGTQVPTSFSCR